MFSTKLQVLGLFSLSSGILASASPLVARASSSDSFGLYAYGGDLGGLPVFYADGGSRQFFAVRSKYPSIQLIT